MSWRIWVRSIVLTVVGGLAAMACAVTAAAQSPAPGAKQAEPGKTVKQRPVRAPQRPVAKSSSTKAEPEAGGGSLLVVPPDPAAKDDAKAGRRPERKAIAKPLPIATPVITPPTPAEQRQLMLAPVTTWAYQLRQIRFPQIAQSPADLVVIDHAFSAGRRFINEFSPEQIRQIRTKPDGRRRLVLAYLSIGEAERYRFYWKQDWFDADKKPAWLGDMNTVWDGNYLVRYWDPDWQRLIFGTPQSYLERIKAAGFDGIHVDRADVHADWKDANPEAEKAMVSFVTNLAQAARANDPYFLVIMQNAEELVAHKAVVDAIDGIAKEDLFYGVDHKATENVRKSWRGPCSSCGS